MSLEVPRRARYIRTILAELQRIASHCLWLGTHAMDMGAMTVFLYAFRERELVLDLFEEYCGARLTYNAMRIGGLPLDIPPGWDRKVREFCDLFEQKVAEYEELLTHNRIWLDRTQRHRRHQRRRRDRDRPDRSGAARVGRAARRPQGRALRRVRGARVRRADRDRRRHLRSLPRADGGVPPVDPDHPPGARRAARGPIIGKVPRLIRPPAGETYHAIESPKGELGFFIVSDGKSNTPYRFRVRPPSFCNLQALPRLIKGISSPTSWRSSGRSTSWSARSIADGRPTSSPCSRSCVLLNAVLVSVTFMTLLERKVIAWVQVRLGPMRVGRTARSSRSPTRSSSCSRKTSRRCARTSGYSRSRHRHR